MSPHGCGGLSLADTPLIVGSFSLGCACCSTPQCLQRPVHNTIEVFQARHTCYYVNTYLHIHIYTHVYNVYTYIYIYVHIYIDAFILLFMHAFVCVCVCVCVYIYTHTLIQTHTPRCTGRAAACGFHYDALHFLYSTNIWLASGWCVCWLHLLQVSCFRPIPVSGMPTLRDCCNTDTRL